MKANELRIGNWVDSNIEGCRRVDFGQTELCQTAMYYLCDTDDFERLKPIPLTEDWLEKFGFELTYESKFRRCFDLDTSIGFLSFNFSKVIQEKDNVSIASLNLKWASLKYVHQLQNLYFALTGEELTINEEATV